MRRKRRDAERCDECGEKIQNQHVVRTERGTVFCSQRCYATFYLAPWTGDYDEQGTA